MNRIKKMVGILNIRTCLILIVIFNIFSACKNKEENRPQKIIENNFLKIVDTFAYKHGTFRPLAPNPRSVSESLDSYPQLSIYLYKKVENNKVNETEIKNFLKREKLDSKFKEIISDEYSVFTFDSSFLKKIGRYNISLDTIKTSKIKYAGEVKFSNFKISDNLGYFVVQLSDGKDSQIGLIVVIEKRNGKWIIIRRETLYIT
jgi:hypothetical protein